MAADLPENRSPRPAPPTSRILTRGKFAVWGRAAPAGSLDGPATMSAIEAHRREVEPRDVAIRFGSGNPAPARRKAFWGERLDALAELLAGTPRPE